MPPWTPGTFDIHQLHTGRGNASLLVFPDGTRLLLDAGGVPEKPGLELGPAARESTAARIASYIKPDELDYAVITHYHDDHMGAFPELAKLVHVRTLIDRGTEPAPPPYPPALMRDYFALRTQMAQRVQTFDVGNARQIVPRHAAVPDFEVRNLAGNGRVWTGSGTRAASRFPDNWPRLPAAQQPDENSFSLALLIRYGAFRYFAGGDLPGVPLDGRAAWHDLESPVARVTGRVDAAVLNHHGWLDTTNAFFLETLNPRVVVIPAWHASHPDHGVLRRLRGREVFATTLLPAARAVFPYLLNAVRGAEGHILIRVAPGGAAYRVFVLDASSSGRQRVQSAHGPYQSRGQ